MLALVVVIAGVVWGAIQWVNGGSDDMKEPGEAVVQRDAPETADDVQAALQQDMDAGADVFYGRISSVIEKMMEMGSNDLTQAKAYQAEAREFLTANKDKIARLAAENGEIAGLVEIIADSMFFVNMGLEK